MDKAIKGFFPAVANRTNLYVLWPRKLYHVTAFFLFFRYADKIGLFQINFYTCCLYQFYPHINATFARFFKKKNNSWFSWLFFFRQRIRIYYLKFKCIQNQNKNSHFIFATLQKVMKKRRFALNQSFFSKQHCWYF